MTKRKMRITMNALSISSLAALSLTPIGSGAKAKDLTPEEKFSETKRDAEAGNADAQYNLGEMYESGDGVPKDSAKAVEWYQKAAAQGNAGAQSLLGVMYAFGEGVPKDSAKAVEWYQKAAAQGDTKAQNT